MGGSRFVMISAEQFIEQTLPLQQAEGAGLTEAELRADLDAMIAAKRAGKTCEQCGQPMWVAGSSLAGYPCCFLCLTGEKDCSKDFEVEA